MQNDHRSKFCNLSNWKEEAWKDQGFNRIQTRDLRDTGAMLYQLSYEAAHWERGQFIEFVSPVRNEMMLSICEAWKNQGFLGFFQAASFQLQIKCDDHSSLSSTTAVQI